MSCPGSMMLTEGVVLIAWLGWWAMIGVISLVQEFARRAHSRGYLLASSSGSPDSSGSCSATVNSWPGIDDAAYSSSMLASANLVRISPPSRSASVLNSPKSTSHTRSQSLGNNDLRPNHVDQHLADPGNLAWSWRRSQHGDHHGTFVGGDTVCNVLVRHPQGVVVSGQLVGCQQRRPRILDLQPTSTGHQVAPARREGTPVGNGAGEP
jgi:hypothetical protein